MLSEKAKAAIDRLSVDELRYEAELGRASRFQREKFAYVKARLAELEEARQITPGAVLQDNGGSHIHQIEADRLAEFLTQAQELRDRLGETPLPVEEHNRWVDQMNGYFRERNARAQEARLSDFSGIMFYGDDSERAKMSRSIDGRSRRLHEFISETTTRNSPSGSARSEKSPQVLLLKPSAFGIGIDLRAAWNWIRSRWSKSDTA